MESLIVVLLIVFLLSTSKKNKARVEAKRKQQGKPTVAPAKPPARLTPEERAARIEELRNLKAQRTAQAGKAAAHAPGGAASVYARLKDAVEAALEPAPTAAPQAPIVPEAPLGEGLSRPGSLAAASQGQSAFDDEGCLGGSLAHEHTEGESRAEHDQHIAAMKARDAEEAAFAAPHTIAALDATRLRRAVVISEILGKPKALQRRR